MTLHPLLNLNTLLLLTLCSITTTAAPSVHHDPQTVHVHGMTEIQMLIGVNQIEILLESPAIDIVGFERTAKTKMEKQQVLDAKAILSRPASLFHINDIRCSTVTSIVNVHGLLENDHPHTKQSAHSGIKANYQLSCPAIDALKSIEFKIFSHFPNISELNIQWVSETEQGQRVLNASNNRLVFGN